MHLEDCGSPSNWTHSILFRLHGSYERLWAGQVSEAFVDLTGGLAERWSLADFGSEDEQRPEQDSDQVRRRRLDLNLLYPVKDDCALSCSTHSSPGGLKNVLFLQIQVLFLKKKLVLHHLMFSLPALGASELGQYHALTVMEWLDVKTVSGSEVRLLRIRNPWGRCCWGGAWIEGYSVHLCVCHIEELLDQLSQS